MSVSVRGCFKDLMDLAHVGSLEEGVRKQDLAYALNAVR